MGNKLTMKYSSFASIKGLILDMDGVLWRGEQPLGDLPNIFSTLIKKGYRTILATNNATLSAEQYLQKLARFGVQLEYWQVINSSQATAHFLHEQYPQGGPIFIIGEDGLIETVCQDGFYQANQNVLAVVVGMDRTLTYEKLSIATLLIRSGASFIGTNPDRSFPTPLGLVPGAGAILAALEVASGIKPVIIGKPAPEMYRLAMERLSLSPEETLVIGDRLETDIVGAQALGCCTALVLSGVTSYDESLKWKPAPDIITKDLTTLLESL
jgi:4-nitrophenyl phosphatase